ncbi:hypothetical protein [Actinopolyspora mortivallis]|uniref:hypothetical protein n=1 Tax=Actinopolyspora mortivallis TaxID=33906 RepID=UPI0012EDB681|nr:hypothetical protein [Actinopolyspora mortivallis]
MTYDTFRSTTRKDPTEIPFAHSGKTSRKKRNTAPKKHPEGVVEGRTTAEHPKNESYFRRSQGYFSDRLRCVPDHWAIRAFSGDAHR